jgi:hypothetical protein
MTDYTSPAWDAPPLSDRPLYSPACPACGNRLEWHYDAHNDEYLCQRGEAP